jgi:hypothetical protein
MWDYRDGQEPGGGGRAFSITSHGTRSFTASSGWSLDAVKHRTSFCSNTKNGTAAMLCPNSREDGFDYGDHIYLLPGLLE